jgi:hypothetical protein
MTQQQIAEQILNKHWDEAYNIPRQDYYIGARSELGNYYKIVIAAIVEALSLQGNAPRWVKADLENETNLPAVGVDVFINYTDHEGVNGKGVGCLDISEHGARIKWQGGDGGYLISFMKNLEWLNESPSMKVEAEKSEGECPNCKETQQPCACIRNTCHRCKNPVGNITFSVCDDCWKELFPSEKGEKVEAIGVQPASIDIKREAEWAWEKENAIYPNPNGINPYAYVLGYKAGRSKGVQLSKEAISSNLVDYAKKQEQQYYEMSDNRNLPYWTGRADSWKEAGDYLEPFSKHLIDYIYDFAWHYGRLWHIGDADKIKAAIQERFQLPEEFLTTKGVQPEGISEGDLVASSSNTDDASLVSHSCTDGNSIEQDEETYSPYCKICEACGHTGCCGPLQCKQHPEGDYCERYLEELKIAYGLNIRLFNKLYDEQDKYKELFEWYEKEDEKLNNEQSVQVSDTTNDDSSNIADNQITPSNSLSDIP